MILSAQTIRFRMSHRIEPFIENGRHSGMSFGLSAASYDIRVGNIGDDKDTIIMQPGDFRLISSLEKVRMPSDLAAMVHDKSTLARLGIALQNTFIDPGFEGYITLEVSNHSDQPFMMWLGQPIAQLVFHKLDRATEMPYKGKYSNQPSEPVEARFER